MYADTMWYGYVVVCDDDSGCGQSRQASSKLIASVVAQHALSIRRLSSAEHVVSSCLKQGSKFGPPSTSDLDPCLPLLQAAPVLAILPSMSRYQIFLGAPTFKRNSENDVATPAVAEYRWQIAGSNHTILSQPAAPESRQDVYHLPPATLEAAGRRISMLYENIIFKDVDSLEEDRYMGTAEIPDRELPQGV